MNASGSEKKLSVKSIKVRQVRSSSGRTKSELETLKALGLGRIGKEKVHNVSAAVLGMIRKVEHVLCVSPVE